MKAAIRVYVFHCEDLHAVREKTYNPAASIRDACFRHCACGAADVLPALLAGKNVLDGGGADVPAT